MGRKKEYVFLVLLGVIVLAAGGYLFQVWEGYHEASAGYQKLQKYIIEKPDVEKKQEEKPESKRKSGENLPEIDFDGLRAINKDIVAWIQIPGIGVDYPVVQGCVLFIAFIYVLVNLIVDLLYAYIDPRISYD